MSRSIYTCNKTRRQFLIGAGNTLLALPLLPSLLPRKAFGQAADMPPPRLFLMRMAHNSVSESVPNPSLATQAVGNIGARMRPLNQLGAQARDFMPILRHQIYNNLLNNNQLTLVQGLNGSTTGHGVGTIGGRLNNHPTIDWAIENSQSLYPANTPSNVVRALRIQPETHDPVFYLSGGRNQNYPSYGTERNDETVARFYDRVFGSLTAGTNQPADNTNQLKSNILNRVLGSYQSTMSNRRISAEDLQRVEAHMDYLSDIQRSFASMPDAPPPVTCNQPNQPNPPSDANELGPAVRVYLPLLAIALQCRLTKFAYMGGLKTQDPQDIPGLVLPSGLGVHGAFHGPNDNPDVNPLATPNLKQATYELVNGYIFDLLGNHFFNMLNVQEGNTGRTYIDNMTSAFLWELSTENRDDWSGHGCWDLQHMIIGSMGGRIRSGNMYYYGGENGNNNNRLDNNTMLITLLRLLGIPSSEYSQYSNAPGGFGYYDNNHFGARRTQPLIEMLA